MSVIWLVAESGGLAGLSAELAERGVELRRTGEGRLPDAAFDLYDGAGVVVVDARSTVGRAVLVDSARALVPVVAIAPPEVDLTGGVLRLTPEAPPRMAHHLMEVLAEPRNLRRHPRVPVRLPVRVGEQVLESIDISLYGLRVQPDGPWAAADGVRATAVYLEDGARIALSASVVARRTDGVALRCRPQSDEDLLLWIHLILEGLERSPLHAEADPFGALFE